MSLVNVSHLTVRFHDKTVLADVYLTVNRDEIVTVIGPNGAGKSTLIRAILGLVPKTQGSIERAPNLVVGYMPQKLYIDPFLPLSVERFLYLAGGKLAGFMGGKKVDPSVVKQVTEMLSITHLLKSRFHSISGGELQRVLLARAILRKPDFLVLDEPGQGIDVLGQEELYQLILEVRDKLHCGILMVSHDLHLVMAGTDFVICLNKHVCCSGPPDAVSHHPEFLNLFGLTDAAGIAVYTHRHNHRHDLDGGICK